MLAAHYEGHRGCEDEGPADSMRRDRVSWLTAQGGHRIRLEAATICQLACPSCPTTQGVVKAQIGAGFLRFEQFRRIVDDNPRISEIELSNWGEIFLNPDIERIIEYAYRRNVALSAWNGANLNHVRDSVLEAMVRCKFRVVTCSIDGATRETYEIYRRKGDLARVLDNIRKLNAYKTRWRSRYPKLLWQMIVFGHNQHEIAAARSLARELDMTFVLKTNWDPDYSSVPQRSSPAVTAAGGSPERQPAADPAVSPERDEAQSDGICYQLWNEPQINFDGALLGCCVNTWGTFGDNAFEVGLERALASPGLRYAKEMLLGKAPPKAGIPCTTCAVYATRSRAQRWLPPEPRGGLTRVLQRHGLGRWVVWIDNRLGRYLSPLVRSLHLT